MSEIDPNDAALVLGDDVPASDLRVGDLLVMGETDGPRGSWQPVVGIVADKQPKWRSVTPDSHVEAGTFAVHVFVSWCGLVRRERPASILGAAPITLQTPIVNTLRPLTIMSVPVPMPDRLFMTQTAPIGWQYATISFAVVFPIEGTTIVRARWIPEARGR